MAFSTSITRTWQGVALDHAHAVSINLEKTPIGIAVHFVVPLYEPPHIPAAPAGFTHGLWEYDVFEIFIVRPDGSYIEVEVGPGGQYLVYTFPRYREYITQGEQPLAYTYTMEGKYWKGVCTIPIELVGGSLSDVRWNFYTIRERAGAREYSAWHSMSGIEPDFHRTECFAAVQL